MKANPSKLPKIKEDPKGDFLLKEDTLSEVARPRKLFRYTSSVLVTVLLTFVLLGFISCQKVEEESTPAIKPNQSTPALDFENPEEAFPGEVGVIKKGSLFGEPITYTEINGQAVFQGDIILTPEQLSETESRNGRIEGAGRTKMVARWPYNIVYYTIDPNLPSTSQTRVTEAITYWKANSPIKFVVRTTQTNYVTFRSGSGCSSSVGMIGGQQFISLSTACTTGNIIHEIDHALGIWHEQSRADRDNHVTIHWDNITPGQEHNFQTYVQRGVDGFDHSPFDFGSVMMYGPFSFSNNNQPTITRKDGSLYTVQRNGLSVGDKALVKVMYLSKDGMKSGTKTYFFSGNHYIRVSMGDIGPGTLDAGYPKPISNWGWGSFGKQGIDATLKTGTKAYLFSGTQYVRLSMGSTEPGTVDVGYPRHISHWNWGTFGKNGIDAAFKAGTKAYFFSGNQYIRVTMGDIGPGTIDVGYPRHISHWNWGSFGQNGIDAAIKTGTKAYFFSGNQYIRVSMGNIGPGTIDVGYPRHISHWNWPTTFRW